MFVCLFNCLFGFVVCLFVQDSERLVEFELFTVRVMCNQKRVVCGDRMRSTWDISDSTTEMPTNVKKRERLAVPDG